MNRKPRPYNPPTIVTPEVEQAFLEQLAARDESHAEALERYYAQDEWWSHSEEARQARERLDAAQGITRP